jgi:hypothetical protein
MDFKTCESSYSVCPLIINRKCAAVLNQMHFEYNDIISPIKIGKAFGWFLIVSKTRKT